MSDWTQEHYVLKLEAEIESLEADYKRLYEKHNAVGKEHGELLLKNERLRSEVLHWQGMTKGRESEIEQRVQERNTLRAALDMALYWMRKHAYRDTDNLVKAISALLEQEKSDE